CVYIRDDYGLASSGACGLGGEQTDHARTDDQRRFATFDLCNAHSVQCDGHRLKHRGLFEGELVGQGIEDACRNRNQLRKGAVAPVVAARDAEHLPVVTQINLASLAELATAAVHGGIKGHAVAHLVVLHVRADTLDSPGALMSHDDGRDSPPGGAVVPMNIAATDTAGCYTNQH